MKFPIQRTKSGSIQLMDYLKDITQHQAIDLLSNAHPDGVLFHEFEGHLLMGLTATADYFSIKPIAIRALMMNYYRLFAGGETIHFSGIEKDRCEKFLNEPRSRNKVIETFTPLGLLRIATLEIGELPEILCGQLALIQSNRVDNTFDEETMEMINAS
jgi:hypothetical protein